MKASGVDSLSRGDLTEGMMAGKDPLSFLPFNRGADDRAGGKVSAWVHSWWKTKKGTPFKRKTELERDERKTEFELDMNWTGIGQELDRNCEL